MIGSRFITYLKPVPPRHLSRVNLFLSFLNFKIDDGTMRASYLTSNSYGMRLLTQIIKLADLDTLLLPDDPYKRRGSNLISWVKDLEKPIDVRQGKRTQSSLFIKSKQPCFELMIPSRRRNPLVEIPYGKPWSHSDWRKIKPFRITEMGPCDLIFKVFDERLDYTKQGPTHAIYTLDCFALVSMFVAYYQDQSSVPDLDQLILTFLHNEIVIPTLLNDSTALWLRNIYRQQFMSGSILSQKTPTVWDTITTDTLGADFNGAMVDIDHLKKDLRKGSISDLSALSSLLMTTKDQSLTSYYKELYDTTQSPDVSYYIWVDVLKNMGWWEMILLTGSFSSGFIDSTSFKRELLRDVRTGCLVRPWNEIPGSIPYKTYVKSHLEDMYKYLDSL